MTTAPPEGKQRGEALFEVKRVIVGQDRMVERMFTAVLARGHCLLEGVPGVAKTLAAKTLAHVAGGRFARLQFTPDLVPSDITGTRIYRPSQEAFDIEPGPVIANVVLADEINRAPAKVQSALLEVMGEYRVSIGGTTLPVPEPFLVLATQNPIEVRGRLPAPRGAARPQPARHHPRQPGRRTDRRGVGRGGAPYGGPQRGPCDHPHDPARRGPPGHRRRNARALADADVDLAAAADEPCEEFAPLAAGRGLSLRRLSPGLTVIGDHDALRRAVGNLLSNAVRLAPPGTLITIAAGRSGSWLWTAVQDEGPGILDDDQARVFDRFWRAKGNGGSRDRHAGLGPAIVRQIVGSHCGQVRLFSRVGEGSTLVLWVPAPAGGHTNGGPPEERPAV